MPHLQCTFYLISYRFFPYLLKYLNFDVILNKSSDTGIDRIRFEPPVIDSRVTNQEGLQLN